MQTLKQTNKHWHIISEKYTTTSTLLTFKIECHWKYKFSNTAASLTIWSIFFSDLSKNDRDKFLLGNWQTSSLYGPILV